MTEKLSVRAAARAHYRAAMPSGDPEPRDDGAPADAASLMTRTRKLYEDGIVPVREIAQLVGVSERTLYKHARRGGWRRRYARGEAKAEEGAQPAMVRGAGGRFIRRAEAGEPHAQGLKALDPTGAAMASARCATAQQYADDAAQATARDMAERDMAVTRRERAERRGLDRQLRTLDSLGAALVDLAKGHARDGRRYAVLAGALQRLIDAEMRTLLGA
jgi:hypothetical protein